MISNRYLGSVERYPPSLDLDRRYVDLQLSRLWRLYPSRMTQAYPAGLVFARPIPKPADPDPEARATRPGRAAAAAARAPDGPSCGPPLATSRQKSGRARP
jgi:hypothetical protein